MTSTHPDGDRTATERGVARREVLRGAAGAAAAGLAVQTAAPVAAQAGDEPDYGGWFDDVGNYDGTVDATGQDEVSISVGAEGNGGAFAFDPPAVRVDPGTTVVWEWTGEGGAHNVAADDGDFESEMTDEAGFTFERTLEQEGIVRYVCVPHEAMGMKGALVVGDPSTGGSGGGLGDALAVGGGLGLFGALVAMFALGLRSNARKHRPGR